MRQLTLVVLLVSLLVVAPGCGDGGSASDDGVVEIRWLTDNNPLRQQQVDLFHELHPEIRVELDVSHHGLDKILTQLAAGSGPDLTDFENIGALRTVASRGGLVDITDLAAEYDIDTSRYLPQCRDWMEVDGRHYALPHGGGAMTMLCNLDAFEEAGVPIPSADWTWAEFVEVAAALTKKDERGRYERFGYAGPLGWAWYHWLWQNGADIFNEDGTVCTLDTPEARETMQYLYDLRETHHVCPTESDYASLSGGGGWGSGEVNLFAIGKLAMVERDRGILIVLRERPDVRWAAVPLPRGRQSSTMFLSRPVGITRDCDNIDAAMTFMAFVHGRPYQEQIIDIADGSPSRLDVLESEAFLNDSVRPDEAPKNRIFLEQMKQSRNIHLSPHVPFPKLTRILDEELDRMWNGLSTPDETCERMTRRLNDEIAKSLNAG